MGVDVIVLNGASSAGKSSVARCLQDVLPSPWLTLGIDDLIHALPLGLDGADSGIAIDGSGVVTVGHAFRALEAAWYLGLAAIARGGVGVVVDEVFLGGAASQGRLRNALVGLDVLWVGVHCELDTLVAREGRRPDRVPGLAANQAGIVHAGVQYDLEVDTTHLAPSDVAATIAVRAGLAPPGRLPR